MAVRRICGSLPPLCHGPQFDERESARTTGLAIDRHGNVGGLGDGREVGAEVRLARTVGEVPDEQTDCQGLLVKSPLIAAGLDSISKTHGKVKGQGQGAKVPGKDLGLESRSRNKSDTSMDREQARPSQADTRAARPMTVLGALSPWRAARGRRYRRPTYSASRRAGPWMSG